MKKANLVLTIASVLLLSACNSQKLLESVRIKNAMTRDIPFRIDSLQQINREVFSFANSNLIEFPSDYEINKNGEFNVSRTTFAEPVRKQAKGKIWRNLFFSKKDHRIVCVDRLIDNNRSKGFVYLLQSKSKKYPTYGTYIWDITDNRNLEFVGKMLDKHLERTLDVMNGQDRKTDYKPKSQNECWSLIFHADSLMDIGEFMFSDSIDKAITYYDRAFSVGRYILPSQLTVTAKRLEKDGYHAKAVEYIQKRINLEKDFYMEPSSVYESFNDIFRQRAKEYGYNLKLKERLEEIIRRDAHDRVLWYLAKFTGIEDTVRTDELAQKSLRTDSCNLVEVYDILEHYGYPGVKEVGDFGSQAVWLVFQHAPLEYQKKFLPVIEQATKEGKLPRHCLAMLEDRINIREGRPQKYGTQRNYDGKVCKLLDPKRVNEWRKEVGLPAIKL